MFKLLIVDDQYEKVQGIVQALDRDDINYENAQTARCALEKLKHTKYDLIIIDLQIPQTLGDDISIDGGVKLLENININTSIKKPTHIIGFTSHRESYVNFHTQFEFNGWGIQLFDGDYEAIKSIINKQLAYFSSEKLYCDVAIITALEHTELEAVKQLGEWDKIHVLEDSSTYYKTTITNKKGMLLTLIAVSCHGMGMAHAAAITMKVALKFSPKYILMTGIAAGIEGKVEFGDILIADTCWDWGNGKQTIKNGKPVFLASPKQELLDEPLRVRLRSLVIARTYLDEIYNQCPVHMRPRHALQAHIGPMASGAVVLENSEIVEAIKQNNRDTIGIEMEAYAVMLAIKLSSTSPPIPLIIKSVCDFADPSKDDNFQGYAAYTSAKYAFKIIENELEF